MEAVKPNFLAGILVILAAVLALQGTVYAQWGELEMPLPANDPQWRKVKALWDTHWGGKNLPELIAVLTPLKDTYSDRMEPYLWLARAHYLHARYIRSEREHHFEQSERYAVQACKMAPNNPVTIKVLVDTLIHSRDRSYIFGHYDTLIRSYAPLKDEEALPPMKNYPEWEAIQPLWDGRADIQKAERAMIMFENLAKAHPNDALAQAWASHANYYLGECYTSLGEHDTKAMPLYRKGMAYAQKARTLKPHSVAANYWYQNNLARSIQFTSLLNKARYLNDITTPLMYCDRENSTYSNFGPVLTLGVIIANGGWVAEQGMKMAGIRMEMAKNAMEIAEILYPRHFTVPFIKADILASKGKKKEARAVLEKLLAKNPDDYPQPPYNLSFYRMAKTLYSQIQEDK
jgi:tetratricopeptide (TPR) repeat protein